MSKLDARPSDAIALALGNDVPIHVQQAKIDEAGIPAPPSGVPADGGSTSRAAQNRFAMKSTRAS